MRRPNAGERMGLAAAGILAAGLGVVGVESGSEDVKHVKSKKENTLVVKKVESQPVPPGLDAGTKKNLDEMFDGSGHFPKPSKITAEDGGTETSVVDQKNNSVSDVGVNDEPEAPEELTDFEANKITAYDVKKIVEDSGLPVLAEAKPNPYMPDAAMVTIYAGEKIVHMVANIRIDAKFFTKVYKDYVVGVMLHSPNPHWIFPPINGIEPYKVTIAIEKWLPLHEEYLKREKQLSTLNSDTQQYRQGREELEGLKNDFDKAFADIERETLRKE